jgi:hypothetical protein
MGDTAPRLWVPSRRPHGLGREAQRHANVLGLGQGRSRPSTERRVTRFIDDDASRLEGPPYAVDEIVFDEDDQVVCFRSQDDMLVDRED